MALEYGKALCKTIGSTKQGAIEVQFNDETMLDLITEQGIWPIIYHVFDEAFRLHAAKAPQGRQCSWRSISPRNLCI